MGVVYCRELPRERSQSGKYRETYVYSRAWIVRVDDPATPLPDITNAAGIPYLGEHPDDPSCKALEFETRVADDTGLVYTYTVKYQTPPVDNEDGEKPQEPSSIPGLMKIPIWSASSSVTTGPVGVMVNNSAGDPLPGLEQEFSEFRLTLTEYHISHSTWMADATAYTNRVNSGTWNGGSERRWKCQGMSAQLQTENVGSTTINYWEVTWEFAYKKGSWNILPWDVGFHERCGTDGFASASGDKRKTIVGQDKKPVKQPVALQNGVAMPPGTPPTVINGGDGVNVYGSPVDFGSRFGQVFTP